MQTLGNIVKTEMSEGLTTTNAGLELLKPSQELIFRACIEKSNSLAFSIIEGKAQLSKMDLAWFQDRLDITYGLSGQKLNFTNRATPEFQLSQDVFEQCFVAGISSEEFRKHTIRFLNSNQYSLGNFRFNFLSGILENNGFMPKSWAKKYMNNREYEAELVGFKIPLGMDFYEGFNFISNLPNELPDYELIYPPKVNAGVAGSVYNTVCSKLKLKLNKIPIKTPEQVEIETLKEQLARSRRANDELKSKNDELKNKILKLEKQLGAM